MQSTSIFPPFFETNDYFIDERVAFFKMENLYKVYDGQGVQRGNIVQKLSGWQKVLRLLINKAMMPFALEVKNMEEEVLVTIRRGWTFWMSKIQILDAGGAPIGSIKQKFKFFKPTFEILDLGGVQLGKISGDWKAWNFSIESADGRPIGTITKKWAGIAKEIFTSADKYNVHIEPDVAEDSAKIAIVAAAITIDMVLKESK